MGVAHGDEAMLEDGEGDAGNGEPCVGSSREGEPEGFWWGSSVQVPVL